MGDNSTRSDLSPLANLSLLTVKLTRLEVDASSLTSAIMQDYHIMNVYYSTFCQYCLQSRNHTCVAWVQHMRAFHKPGCHMRTGASVVFNTELETFLQS